VLLDRYKNGNGTMQQMLEQLLDNQAEMKADQAKAARWWAQDVDVCLYTGLRFDLWLITLRCSG
jgi:hypothetical protein